MRIEIVRAGRDHVREVSRLFDLYRQFYGCDPDPGGCEQFVGERLNNGESVIFVAEDEHRAVGFTQLYPSFCSVDAVKILILYDLFVDKAHRNCGIGAKLMGRAKVFAEETGVSRIDLLTAKTNKPGQHLYEKLGYQKTLEDFYAYSLAL